MFTRTRRWAGAGSVLVIGGCSGVHPGDLFEAPPSEGGPESGTGDAGAQVALDATSATVPVAPAIDAGALDEGVDASESGTAIDAPPVACSVTFIVTGAAVDGFSLQGVYLGGDSDALGHWDATAARPLVQISPGVWTTSLVMNDGDRLQFRFLERGPMRVQWEDWGPNSNRSLRVACLVTDDGGAADAGGTAVVGTAYTGQFGARPADAT